ncbi:MAG: hypothetical protein OEW39_14880, partial [Deltaproteobacteria bacterium]|nr:hypothetical protein [Deltaproteobacteria bacterium]
MPPSAEDEGFFGQLARWEGAESARSAFTRLTAQAPGLAPAQMREGVYRRLAEFLLRRLGLIANSGAPGAEWLPLLRWDAETNAGYFTHRSIESLFSHWPGLTPAQRTRMEEVVTGWLHLGREGFPARMTLLLSPEDLSRWLRLFPSGWLWEAASLLEGLGFSVPVSQCGATAWLRHEEGKFAIPDTPEAMRRWQAACWETPAFRGEGTLEASVHRTNFVAAAFAGRYTALGI